MRIWCKLYFSNLLFLFIICHKISSQSHYIKIIDEDSLSQISQQIVMHDENFLLGYYQTCASDLQSQCSGILKLDGSGKIIDKVLLEKFSNNANSILVTDSSILLTGEVYNDQVDAHEFLINIIDKTTFKLAETKIVKDSARPLIIMSQLANTKWNNKYVLAGDGRVVLNSYNRAAVYVLDSNYKLDSMLLFDFANKNMACWNVFVDNENNLSVLLAYQHNNDRFTSIMKFDTSYNLVWQWKSPRQRLALAYPHGLETDDGDMVLTLDDVTFSSINRIYKIRRDSTVEWIANWPGDYGNQARYIDRLRKAKNGDIIGVGRHSEFLPNLRLERVPFIFRLDPNGNFKWIKIFYKDQKYSNGYLVQGGFSDVVEADNGDLIAVGRIHNVLAYDPRVFGPRNDWDIIVARLGPDGCIESGCPDINKIDNLIVDSEEVNINDDIKIYPNPFHTHFTVASSEKIDHITVFNTTGQLVSRSIGNNEIDLSTASYGLYFVELLIGSRRVLKKVIKE